VASRAERRLRLVVARFRGSLSAVACYVPKRANCDGDGGEISSFRTTRPRSRVLDRKACAAVVRSAIRVGLDVIAARGCVAEVTISSPVQTITATCSGDSCVAHVLFARYTPDARRTIAGALGGAWA
jgi:hypothetical protein